MTGRSVVEAFESAADGHAARPALKLRDRVLTYGEVEAIANRFARRLAAQGVEQGSIVGIATPRSPEAIIAWIAVLKCGAAYLPLDAQTPVAAMNGIIADAAPVLVLRSREITAPDLAGRVLGLEDEIALSASQDASRPGTGIAGDDLAYIMYTSGSTGRPNGVLVPHRAILRLTIDPDYVTLSPDVITLQLAPLAFDASTLEVWGTLLNGGLLVFYPEPIISVAAVGETLVRERINMLWLTAGLFHLMVETRLDAMRGLRQLLAGGDVLSPTHVRRALVGLPDCTIINGYGPTENTTFSCCYPVPRGGWGEGSLPIGFPIRGTSIRIVDADMREVPNGEEGQLCVGGAGLALGYLGRPALTAERFVADPFSPDPSARLYLTGDIVRKRPDGAIEFFGRRDRQVKIDGNRIELDGIEHELREFNALADAAVVLDTRSPDRKRIIAFLKPAAGIAADAVPGLVTAHLKARLPAYMTPHLMRVLPEFPLNANGKIDRHALLAGLPAEAPQAQRPAAVVSEVRPVRARIADIFADLLGVPQVDVSRNLFELGATSLMIMRAHERVQTDLGRTFPITDMFANPTIASLSQILEAAPAASGAESAQARAQRQRAILSGLGRAGLGRK